MPPRALSMRPRVSLVGTMLAALWLAAAGPVVRAQDAEHAPVAQSPRFSPLLPMPEARHTRHTLALPGRTLAFTATAGAIPIAASDGTLLADVGYFAYALDGAEQANRPVVFAFNGGPGSSSVWLHLGSLGPWRVPLTVETMTSRAPPELVPNSETWLEHADLVFIDPPGTGHSRIAPTAARSDTLPVFQHQGTGGAEHRIEVRQPGSRAHGGAAWFWSLNGDIETFTEVIVAWLRRANRVSSPVVLAGESYGGFRAPLIAHRLQRAHRINVRTLVLVSPVLDFDGRRGGFLPQHYVAMLPSLAATHLERGGTTPTRAALASIETYARGSYMLDLMHGPRDSAAVQRMAEQIAPMIGLTVGQVAEVHGRVGARTMVQLHPALVGRTVSLYDAAMELGARVASGNRRGDAFTGALDVPLRRAMEAVFERLEWRSGRGYAPLSFEASRNWTWRNSPQPPEALSALQELLKSDPRLRVLITHGFTDLVTPYMASATQVDQLQWPGSPKRVALEVYPGGHMFYSRDESRVRFRDDARRTIGSALGLADSSDGPATKETP